MTYAGLACRAFYARRGTSPPEVLAPPTPSNDFAPVSTSCRPEQLAGGDEDEDMGRANWNGSMLEGDRVEVAEGNVAS